MDVQTLAGIVFGLGLLALLVVQILRVYDWLRWYFPQYWNWLFGTTTTAKFLPPASELENVDDASQVIHVGYPQTGKTVRLDQLPSIFDQIYLFEDELGEKHNFVLEPGALGIFGGSGGGKGNLVKILILQALALGPKRAEVWALDFKGYVDYSKYKKFPQVKLFRNDTVGGYAEVVAEIGRRLDLFFDAECENIAEWNELHPDKTMPYILVVCDEIADTTLPEHKPAPTKAREIFAKGRAAGIVGVGITQYPTADIFTSAAQVNIIHRFVFRLSSSKYTAVALGLGPKDEEPPIDPSTFDVPGKAIYKKQGGGYAVVQVFHLTKALNAKAILELKIRQGLI